jgi:deoxyribonuclease-4
MSIAGGVANAFDRAEKVGCEALQIFLKNATQWAAKPIADEERRAFARRRRETGIRSVVAHNSYLVNLCSVDEQTAERSFQSMLDEIRRAALLKVPEIVMHPGAPKDLGETEGLRRVGQALEALLRETADCSVRLLLEATAGQGSTLGWRFEHLAELIERAKNGRRVGVCLDTCHIFAAGYDIRAPKAYAETMREFDRVVGLKKIRAIHLNDSKYDLGARRDRHQHIGKGFIGEEAFGHFVRDERFAKTPGILETPKGPDLAEDVENLAVLRRLEGSGG